ncbi:MAG: hypothetical protein F6J93_08725 [Oscillatoria sp. SIO1A7]|nr:hypothetical protein [Oscillatoria sp. SIO1A7]
MGESQEIREELELTLLSYSHSYHTFASVFACALHPTLYTLTMGFRDSSRLYRTGGTPVLRI